MTFKAETANLSVGRFKYFSTTADFRSASTITERYHTPSKSRKHIDKLLMTSSLFCLRKECKKKQNGFSVPSWTRIFSVK